MMQTPSPTSRGANLSNDVVIALGAILGGSARWFISTTMPVPIGTGFPWGTLGVNLVGCLLMGAARTSFRSHPYPRLQLAVTVGLLGGFTTFSTFSVETIQLMQAQRVFAAMVYQGLSVGLGCGAIVLGSILMEIVHGNRQRGISR